MALKLLPISGSCMRFCFLTHQDLGSCCDALQLPGSCSTMPLPPQWTQLPPNKLVLSGICTTVIRNNQDREWLARLKTHRSPDVDPHDSLTKKRFSFILVRKLTSPGGGVLQNKCPAFKRPVSGTEPRRSSRLKETNQSQRVNGQCVNSVGGENRDKIKKMIYKGAPVLIIENLWLLDSWWAPDNNMC